eukprot:CAMPEP_0172589334 /NCGR_PEP_ID=MMETSP1068-20121228/8116_1 /TAXON_ID=35684 /ORGANISM="Pseudopedinella elastica, Strain CCMP716" /LENGTH=235 /DNA_ID=CAMNT_0013384927 /DNA_START=510 /DNA_END=1214 /DNA_ORIENTATION=+
MEGVDAEEEPFGAVGADAPLGGAAPAPAPLPEGPRLQDRPRMLYRLAQPFALPARSQALERYYAAQFALQQNANHLQPGVSPENPAVSSCDGGSAYADEGSVGVVAGSGGKRGAADGGSGPGVWGPTGADLEASLGALRLPLPLTVRANASSFGAGRRGLDALRRALGENVEENVEESVGENVGETIEGACSAGEGAAGCGQRGGGGERLRPIPWLAGEQAWQLRPAPALAAPAA